MWGRCYLSGMDVIRVLIFLVIFFCDAFGSELSSREKCLIFNEKNLTCEKFHLN